MLLITLFSDEYRYGFNGMEKDDEVKGSGNSYDFGARMYDSRLGRWLKTDAVKKPYLSNYQFARLNPLIYLDSDGNDEHIFFYSYDYYGQKGKHTIWNDNKQDIKIPLADMIIKDGQSKVTYYMAIPRDEAPSISSKSFVIRPGFPSNFTREESVQIMKDEILEGEGLTEESLYNVTWTTSEYKSEITGETTVTVSGEIAFYEKVEINSPMTISGGDEMQGFKKIEQSRLTTQIADNYIDKWDDAMGLAPKYSTNIMRDFVRYKLGDCEQNIICAFKDASGTNGSFDYKQTFNTQTLHRSNGKLYNRNELGNFWWGYTAAKLGFTKEEMIKGANIYANQNGRKDEYWEKAAYEEGFDYFYDTH